MKPWTQYIDTLLNRTKRTTVIHFCTAVWNRSNHLEQLVQNMNRLSLSYPHFRLRVADFSSTDKDVREILKATTCKSYYRNQTKPFSLGLGWNQCAKEVPPGDIIVFITADLIIPSRIEKKIFANVQANESFWGPACATEDKTGKLFYQEHGGYAFLAMYQSDFARTSGFPEFEQWGGEDTEFVKHAKQSGLVERRKIEPKIILRWHERDFSTPWYKNSDNASWMLKNAAWWAGSGKMSS